MRQPTANDAISETCKGINSVLEILRTHKDATVELVEELAFPLAAMLERLEAIQEAGK